MKSFRQVIFEERSKSSSNTAINESVMGKGYSAVQNRQHQALRTQVVNKLSAIQNDCRLAVQEDDDHKRGDRLFHLIFDLASAMKDFAEMSARTNNIAAMGVFDQESLKKELAPVIKALTPKR